MNRTPRDRPRSDVMLVKSLKLCSRSSDALAADFTAVVESGVDSIHILISGISSIIRLVQQAVTHIQYGEEIMFF